MTKPSTNRPLPYPIPPDVLEVVRAEVAAKGGKKQEIIAAMCRYAVANSPRWQPYQEA